MRPLNPAYRIPRALLLYNLYTIVSRPNLTNANSTGQTSDIRKGQVDKLSLDEMLLDWHVGLNTFSPDEFATFINSMGDCIEHLAS